MAILEKIRNNKCWRGCGDERTLYTVVGTVNWCRHCGKWFGDSVWRIKKLRLEIPYDPGIPLLGVYLKNTKTLIEKDKCTPMFTAALFTTAEIRKQPKCPSMNEWVKKM